MKRAMPLYIAFAMVVVQVGKSELSKGASWEPAPSLNEARETFAACRDECGNLWVVSGWNRTGGCCCGTGPMVYTIEMLAFDGVSYADQWEVLPIQLPTARKWHSAAVVNGFLYVLGGYDTPAQNLGDLPLATVERYDILLGTWDSQAVPPMNIPRADSSTVVDKFGRIWMIGGQPEADASVVTDTVEFFDAARPSLGWQSGPTMNIPRTRSGAVIDRDGIIHVIGGATRNYVHVQSTETLDTCDPTGWTLTDNTLPDPTTNDDQAILGADGLTYVAGGWRAHSWITRTLRTNPNSGSWELWSDLAQSRSLHRLVLGADDYIYAIGGDTSGCQSSTTVEKLYTGRLACDANRDNVENGEDIQAFIQCLIGGA